MNGFRPRKTIIATAVLYIALLSFLPSCDGDGESTDRQAREQRTSELFSYIPDGNYLSLGYGDIDALMQSDWAQQIIELIPALQVWDEKLGINVDSFHNIAMAFLPPSEEDPTSEEGLILMNSELAAEDIFALLGEKSHFFTEKQVVGSTLYQSGEEFGFGFVSDTVVALGTPELVKNALLLANGQGEPITKSKSMDRYRNYFGSSDNIWIGFNGIDNYMDRAAKEVKMLRNFTHIEFIYFGMAAGDDIASRMILECDSEEAAGKITRGLNGLLGLMGTLIDMQNLDVDVSEYGIQVSELKSMMDEFFSNIDITNDAKNVTISFLVPNRMIDFMVESIRKAYKESSSRMAPDDLDSDTEVEADWP